MVLTLCLTLFMAIRYIFSCTRMKKISFTNYSHLIHKVDFGIILA